MTTESSTVFDVKTNKQDPRYWERIVKMVEHEDVTPSDDGDQIAPFGKMVLWWLWIGALAVAKEAFKAALVVIL